MKKRVLIVDDEDHIRRVMRLTLETAGYEVAEAADGIRGLEAFGDGSAWDAILLDQKMPGIDGLETLRRMKERNAEARVIMVTAFGSIELAVDAMKLGAMDFVRKPMTPEILRNAVTAMLAKPGGVAARHPAVSAPKADEQIRPLISTVTLNGFRFWPAPAAGQRANERAFLVQHPDGRTETVVVEIRPEAVVCVERATDRLFPVEGEFWTAQAEQALRGFLWTEGTVPPQARLVIPEGLQPVLEMANRWERDPV
jgi:CheY-like chemotaxis protein